jgi:16S rRNA (cytosine967-C5)-methyltransferase
VHGDKVKLRNLLKGRVDWMLLDVPCTGSGVMRRNPDMKWKFTVEKMQELLKVQQLILDESLSFLRDDKSRIVYCTCSILPEENMM